VREKIARITGMSAFAVAITFALWYVDYETMRITGLNTNPHGYGSIAYWLIDSLTGTDYGSYGRRNVVWIATQVAPLGLAWTGRAALGRGIRRLYRAI
jgi:hypothetical protein